MTIFARDMNWAGVTNNPTLAGANETLLKIYGSLTFTSSMNLTFSGSVNFEATSTGKTIALAGKVFSNFVYFNGIGGGWTLLDAFTTTYFLFLNNGILNTNNQTVNALAFISNSGSARTLNMGSSIFNLSLFFDYWKPSIYVAGFWWVDPTNLTLNCGTSTINATGNNNLYPNKFFGGSLTYYNLNFIDANKSGGEIWGNNIFNNVSFATHGFIFQNNTFNNLTFTQGHSYVLTSGSIQTINGSLISSGNCNRLITINSSIQGSQSTISRPPGAVVVSFVALKDITAIGGASFTANNVVDLGNNTGWTFNPLISKNLYWIGNSGNWDDGTHWALSSGGPPSGCSPTPLDNVFFDANSFSLTGQTITINTATTHCRDMTWTGVTNNPTLAGVNSNLLKIYGSLTFAAAMNLTFEGNVNFEATTVGKTIASAGKSFKNKVFFKGIGGGWTLQDAFATTFMLYLNNGNLTTNNQTVNALAFISNSGTARTLNMGSSIFNLSLFNFYWDPITYVVGFWWVDPTNMTLNCGTSTINATGFDNLHNTKFFGGNQNYYNLNFVNANIAIGEMWGTNTFNNVSFTSNGIIYESNSFNNITFSPGKNYVLNEVSTQTINGALIANGNCNGLITIHSSVSGNQTTISHPPGAVVVSFVALKDIKAVGGASFTGNNAVDLGNNTGWTFNSLIGKNLYWIGNSGNWDDGNHWSLSSGGLPSGCSPTPLDNVFFDANSFSLNGQTITINTSNAYCRDMIWTGVTNNPTLAGANTNFLKIYGSLTFVTGMNLTFGGFVNFEATTIGKTITTSNKSFNNNINFNGVGGGWTMMDNFTTPSLLFLNSGTLSTNNITVNALSFLSNSGSSRTLNMGSAIFNLSLVDYFYNYLNARFIFEFWNVDPIGMTLNCGTSTINATGRNNIGYVNFNGGSQTYYNLNFITVNTGAGKLNGTNIFHDVNFASDGIIFENNTYNNLTFSAGKTYILESGRTQTVNGRLLIQGSCISYILLKSSRNGFLSTIKKTAGAVLGFNIHMKDIQATGGANFIAYNSVDLGGNSGWNFLSLPALGNLGAVSGLTSVCEGVNGINYSLAPVLGAISYLWTIPPGASITSGQGDTLITVSYVGASSGDITVTASSGCEFSFKKTVPIAVTAVMPPGLSVTANTGNAICAGSAVTFTAVPINGGTTPTYQWQVNGVNAGINSPTFNTSTLSNGDIINAIVTANPSCAIPATATSTPITMTVNPIAIPSINIATGSTTICAGSLVSFNATPSNVGLTPIYTWQVNGIDAGINSPNFSTSSLSNGDVVKAIITSNATCAAPSTATSNSILINVTTLVSPSLNITTSSTTICAGSAATFSAAPTNGGNSPIYQWQVNAVNVGINSPTYTNNTLANGDVVKVNMTSNSTCASPTTATSNIITMAVNSVVTPSINISTSSTSICAGTSASFSSTPINSGTTPSFQWQVNGVNAGTNSPTFTSSSLTNGDQLKVIMSSNASCALPTTATSNSIAMTVNAIVVPAINIATGSTTICSGSSVIFNSIPVNAGVSPLYQWQVNGVNVGSNTPTFTTSNLADGNLVSVNLTSNAICATPLSVNSNQVAMIVNTTVIPSVEIITGSTTICAGSNVSFTANPTNGGSSPSYQWQVNGVNVGSNSLVYSTTSLTNGNNVKVSMTSNAICPSPSNTTSNTYSMVVNPIVTPSVIISASSKSICEGVSVNFIASPTNGGASPVYQWQLNGANVGTNSSNYNINTLANGDVLNVILNSNAFCQNTNTANSNSIPITVVSKVNPSVNITVSPNTICYGTEVTFSASSINGGSSPSYQWKIDNNNIGQNRSTFITNKLANNNVVTCVLTSNAQCPTPNPVTSNDIKIIIDPTNCPQNFFMPTAFTPNKDGKNDLCKPTLFGNVISYKFSIYNRWGQIVFETTDIKKGWDGMANGVDNNTNVFVWMCSFRFDGNNLETRKGTILLLR